MTQLEKLLLNKYDIVPIEVETICYSVDVVVIVF